MLDSESSPWICRKESLTNALSSFYVNLSTNESVWILPTVQPTFPQTQPIIQRKPVPYQDPIPQAAAYSIPQPPSQIQYAASIRPPPQQHGSAVQNHQNFSPPPTPGVSQQQYGYFPPHQYTHPNQRNFTQAPSPALHNPQPSVPTPPIEEQGPSCNTPSGNPNAYFVPPPSSTNAAHRPQHHNNNFASPPQQHAHYPQQAQYYSSAPSQPQHQQSEPLTTFASLSSNPTLNKWSSKLTQLQNKPGATTTPVTARSASAAPTPAGGDWRKWTKRAAIGVAAVGALALGVDAIGDAGAAAFGGGDFSGGGDWSGGGSVEGGTSEALDASAAQIAMEQQGHQNAQMLLDPPGTTCECLTTVRNGGMLTRADTVVDSNSLI